MALATARTAPDGSFSLRPRVYPTVETGELDPVTFQPLTGPDYDNPVDLGFFVRGYPYRIFGLIHADRHGAAIIPHEVADKVPAAVELGARREKVILDAAKARGFGIAKLREALVKMAEIH